MLKCLPNNIFLDYRSLHPIKFYRDYLNQNVRPDGRLLSKYRPVIVNTGSIATADGSALELSAPKPEKPKDGFLICNVDLPPLCSSKFRPGPPSDLAQVTTRFIADLITNSGCINLNDLCIYKEKLVWCLYADLICLDYDGCLIDACLLALLTALKTVKLPSVDYDVAIDHKIVNEDEKKSISVYNTPVSTTYAIFEDKIITDPTAEEEDLSSGLITIVVKDKELCSVHKPGGNSINEEKLLDCIQETIKHADLLDALINTAITEQND
ncbi:hypothetical protein FQR65_LT08673 [Abscondita terminalis]|nr:hypothetical protein FQR65_LT08673 [Abscondita terminalis]